MGTNEIIIEGVARLLNEHEFKELAEIAKLDDVSVMDTVKEALEDYIDYNIDRLEDKAYYEQYIEPFIDECENILARKIQVALEKDKLVLELIRGVDTKDVVIINQMLDYLNDFTISYDDYEHIYSLNWTDPLGNPECEGTFYDAEDFVEWYIEEFI